MRSAVKQDAKKSADALGETELGYGLVQDWYY